MATIGEASKAMARKYYDIYQALLEEFGHEKAKNLAEHDIVVKKIVAEFALEELQQLIEEHRKEKELLEVTV